MRNFLSECRFKTCRADVTVIEPGEFMNKMLQCFVPIEISIEIKIS